MEMGRNRGVSDPGVGARSWPRAPFRGRSRLGSGVGVGVILRGLSFGKERGERRAFPKFAHVF